MLTRLHARPARRGEAGFTLVELVVAVAVLGVVMSAVAAAMIVSFGANKESEARLTESRDIQFASTWFGDDVQSANRVLNTGTPNCGATSATRVVSFENHDYASVPTTPPASDVTALKVAYVVQDAADGAGRELVRRQCNGAGTLTSEEVVARSLSRTATTPVTCYDAAGATLSTCGTSVRRVVLSLTTSGADPVTFTLEGTTRRSS